jgi:hypothetical protein
MEEHLKSEACELLSLQLNILDAGFNERLAMLQNLTFRQDSERDSLKH